MKLLHVDSSILGSHSVSRAACDPHADKIGVLVWRADFDKTSVGAVDPLVTCHIPLAEACRRVNHVVQSRTRPSH